MCAMAATTDDHPQIPGPYWRRAQAPLQALIFLAPLILFYEVSIAFIVLSQDPAGASDVKARRMLFDFFEWLGIHGYYLPGLLVVVVLLSWHLVRGDPWTVRPGLYALMWIESLVLALPLFVFMLVMARLAAGPRLAAAGGAADQGPVGFEHIVLGIGAGIYEELLFRLMGLALLHLVLVDWLKLPARVGAAGAIAVTAVAFAFYHFTGDNPFTLSRFLFYTVAGIYFATVYLVRGFGIVAWVHALYDVLVFVLQMQQQAGGHSAQ